MKIKNGPVRLGILALVVIAASLAAVAAPRSATAATVCSGDVCVVTGGFAGLQADIAASGASAPVVSLLSSEVALSRALYPAVVGALPPGPPVLPSAYLLALVDYQVGFLSGLLPRATCLGGCTFPSPAARLIDGDIHTMLADTTMFPPGLVVLPQFVSGSTR